MKKRNYFVSLTLCSIILTTSCRQAATQEKNYYTQGNKNRLAAEWEPAEGTMIVWPLCIPYKLVIELAGDNHLFTLVADDSSKAEAMKWYSKWGIDAAKNTFIYAPQGIDTWWVRDWGPGAVFSPDGQMKLGDGKYIYSTPVTDRGCADTLEFLYKTADNNIIKTEVDDNATLPFAKGIGVTVIDLPFISTGGNVLIDGVGTAFSTCILLNENKFFGVYPAQFYQFNKDLLGITTYNVLSNFEKRGIQHIDCFLKPLDEERILVAEPPADHELFSIYQEIIDKEISVLQTVYGRPYKIERIKTTRYKGEALAAYTNSIIINKTIYVPLFQVKQDSAALQRWRELMPGYAVKGFTFALADEPIVSSKMREQYKKYGWTDGDALHCRTRAVWDREMLFMSVKTIAPQQSAANKNIVYATIIDYSKKGVIKERSQIIWRIAGSNQWNPVTLKSAVEDGHFSAEIPAHKSGTSIEYFVVATSASGRTATRPATAPAGTYSFTVQ